MLRYTKLMEEKLFQQQLDEMDNCDEDYQSLIKSLNNEDFHNIFHI